MNAQVLDPCSASRMMWFDKGDQRALFGDIRDEEHVLCDGRVLKVEPDVIMDFRHLPFPDAVSTWSCSIRLTWCAPVVKAGCG